ncbi:hypothetical protein AB9M75_03020 [Lactobacillus sp. AN1001]|uniref:hypothetical protein n=1 Tax=Ligilactobacillus animalis TaxID=1605 RepID=UPI003511EBDF
MKKDNLSEVSLETMQENMKLLIKNEDQELSGAGTPGIIGAATAVTAIFQITTACTTKCVHP